MYFISRYTLNVLGKSHKNKDGIKSIDINECLKQIVTYNQREVKILLVVIPAHMWSKLTIVFFIIIHMANYF